MGRTPEQRIVMAAHRLAKRNLRFRRALAREHQKLLRHSMLKTADGSVEDAIKAALGEVALAVGEHLKSKYPKAIKGFSSKPYSAGHMQVAVSSEIASNEEGRTGDIAIEVRFEKGSTPTWVRVWATFPDARPFEVDLFFPPSMDPPSVASRLGERLVRELDVWFYNYASQH